MKNLFRTTVLAAVSFLGSWTTMQAQESTTYFFQGYTYREEGVKKLPSPYLTVVLQEVGNEQPKAVVMSNAVGDCSFYGVPIDIYKDYRLSVYAGDELLGFYLRKGFTKQPSFSGGNINTHTLVSTRIEPYTTKRIELPKRGAISLRQFLSQVPELELEGDVLLLKGASSSLRTFVNGASLPTDKLVALLEQVNTSYLKTCDLILYHRPNEYFAGAINISLSVGGMATFPTDTQYINTLPKE